MSLRTKKTIIDKVFIFPLFLSFHPHSVLVLCVPRGLFLLSPAPRVHQWRKKMQSCACSTQRQPLSKDSYSPFQEKVEHFITKNAKLRTKQKGACLPLNKKFKIKTLDLFFIFFPSTVSRQGRQEGIRRSNPPPQKEKSQIS